MAEEIEVNVRHVEEALEETSSTQIVEVFRRLILAGIGAVALTRDEAENLIKRLVERGEIAQKDGERLLNETVERFQQPVQTSTNLAQQVESNFEQFLNRLNIPSKRDIDELSVKIAQLASRVEELRRSQDQSAGSSAAVSSRSRSRSKKEPAAEENGSPGED
jgi:poly(hydroxyalkanoate) granule-associated protein